ncbi:LPP20 family lipoprotein [bacterium]|nr:LPP20 family lipoprotein [bacterium]
MKRIIILTISTIVIIGCGGSKQFPFDIPNNPDYLYARATATSKDMQHAINSAKESGRVEIARQLETNVSAMFKRFIEETGGGSDAELLQQTADVSKSVVSTTLYGCRARKEDVKKEGGLYRAYVLMEVPIGEANAVLMAQIKAREHLYTRFRAAQGFKELAEEVERYERFKREQGF